MGKFFLMSKRFNKKTPSDFGLIESEYGSVAIKPEDGSTWMPCYLYDYGWGCENGYYRVPLPEYDELLRIVLKDNNQEDTLGAAAIILARYPLKLLETCEYLINTPGNYGSFAKLAPVFNLQLYVNRCPIDGKTYEEIRHDANRWRMIADAVNNMKKTR